MPKSSVCSSLTLVCAYMTSKGDLMEAYKQEFIEFMVESQVLKFGEFTLKSGRKSPFFMNAGAYVTGCLLYTSPSPRDTR